MNTFKTTLKNIIVFVILLVITIYVVYNKEDIHDILSIISDTNPIFLLIGFLFMFTFFCIQAVNVKSLFASLGIYVPYFKMLKFTLIEFFFSAITPASTGGQPVEIYYMSKEGIPVSKSTLVLLIQICSYQFAVLFYTVVGACIMPEVITGIVKYFFIYGVIMNIIVIFAMIICIFSTKTAERIVRFFIKIAKFFHIKKIINKEENIIKGLDKYHEGSDYIKTHKIEFVKSMLRALLQLGCHFVITYFVYRALGLHKYGLISIASMQAIFYASSGCVPLPGAVGISELMYLTIYESVFGTDLLRPAMLLNLGISFYLFVIITLFVVAFNVIKLNMRKGKENE